MDANLQKRMLLIVVISFIFFVLYDYLLIPKKELPAKNGTQQSNQDSANQAPTLQQNIKSPTAQNQAPPTISEQDIIVRITHHDFDIAIDRFGRIAKMVAKSDEYESLELLSPEFVKPLELRFSDNAINSEAFKTPYTASKELITLSHKEENVVLTQQLSHITVTKSLTFSPQGTYRLQVSLSEDLPYFITPGYRPSAAVDPFAFHGALVKEQDDTLSMYDDEDVTTSVFFNNAKIIAAVDKYFVTLFYDFVYPLNGVVDKYKEDNPLLFVQGKNKQIFNGYIGEKNYKKIWQVDKRLTDVIEYGFITFFAKPIFTILTYIHDYVGNWGWAIVVMTIFIRIVLFPLTYKGMVSMNRLKELAPKIKELQEKYKGNPQRSSAAMMELYKKHGANPMGGCFPFILQIPVFFAIYRVLLNAIELKGSEWALWINDLSVQDPYYILPILMGGSMYLQQLLTPTTITDPMQQKIFRFLPLIFTVFFLTFPSGLVLYWLVNNIFSIVQQYYINSIFERKKKLHEQQQR